MELMEISLYKFYKFVYGELFSSIPECMLGKIAVAVSIFGTLCRSLLMIDIDQVVCLSVENS